MKKHEAVVILSKAIQAYIDDNPTHFAENPELLEELVSAEKLVRQDVILRKPFIKEVTLNHIDTDGEWKAVIKDNLLTVSKELHVFVSDNSAREYNIPDVVKVVQEGQYVFLTHPDTAFTQIKFEDGNFLVIDLFNSQGDLLTEIGSHVFGED